nr:uncharacterized protein LOC123497228 [Aegilops tauschii subsp. strangulata]
MDDSLPSPVPVEVACAQCPPADLVAGHVGPIVAQGTNAPARKRQGNVVMQGGNPAAPTGKARAPGANAAARSWPAAEKVGKVSGVKRKRIPATKKSAPSFTPSAPARGSPAMPLNGAAFTASEVFDEMAGIGGSNNATTEFVNLLDTNAVDIDQAPFAAFDYNEMEGGVDDHSDEEELEEIDEGEYEQAQARKSQRLKNYTILEDQILIKAWSAVSLDACTACLEQDKIAQQRYKDMEALEGKFFKLEHCWDLLKECEKWKLIDKESPPKRGSLTNMDEDEDDDGPRNLNKPDGDKKTKEKMKREHEASSLRDKIDAMVQSNELMLAKTSEIKKELAETKAREKQEKWQLLKDEGLRKAAIEERRSRAAENKAMSKLLAEENKIMTLNHNDMDDLTREWHDMARRDILKRRMFASASACYSAGDVFSTGFGTNIADAFNAPADDFGAGVGTSAGGGLRGCDDLDELGGAE